MVNLKRCHKVFLRALSICTFSILFYLFVFNLNFLVACEKINPITSLDATLFYADDAGSIIDKELMNKNLIQQKDLNALIRSLVDAVDRDVNIECAIENMKLWAESRALLGKPTNSAANVRFALLSVNLNAIAVKLKAKRHDLDDKIISWLREITLRTRNMYNRNSLIGSRHYRNNIYFWSASSQALFYLVEQDKQLIEFINTAWFDAVNLIDSDGFLQSELSRGRRSLVYHQFSFSALLIIRFVRRTLNLPDIDQGEDSIRRLSRNIGFGICNSSKFLSRSHSSIIDSPEEKDMYVSQVFGSEFIDYRWRNCAVWPRSVVYNFLGGDLENLSRSIAELGKGR